MVRKCVTVAIAKELNTCLEKLKKLNLVMSRKSQENYLCTIGILFQNII